MRSLSTSVTFAFTAAAMYAATRPAEPAPITTRLRSKRRGFFQRRYTRRARMDSTRRLAISGKKPSSMKAPISSGDRMPRGESMAPSRVPAFT